MDYCLIPILGCLSQVTRYCHKCRCHKCYHMLSIQGTVLQMFPSHSERESELVTAESRVYTASTMQHMLDLPELLPNSHGNSWDIQEASGTQGKCNAIAMHLFCSVFQIRVSLDSTGCPGTQRSICLCF